MAHGDADYIARKRAIDERTRFEAWARENLGQGYPLTMDEGVYENVVTRWAFVAWKAGRRELMEDMDDREARLARVDRVAGLLKRTITAKSSYLRKLKREPDQNERRMAIIEMLEINIDELTRIYDDIKE